MAFSFLKDRKTATAPTKPVNRGDPLDVAKQHIVSAIEGQKRRVNLLLEGETLPREKGKRNVVWFYKDAVDGSYWTALRYGQFTIPLGEDNDTAVQVGKLSDLNGFYDDVISSIKQGEMDEIIAKLRAKRGRRGRSAAIAEASAEEGDQSAAVAAELPRSGRGRRGGRGATAAPAEIKDGSGNDTDEVAKHW